MTSNEIKELLMVDRKRMGMDLAFWLREIALQLALLNERDAGRVKVTK